jgi:hypothetical protein
MPRLVEPGSKAPMRSGTSRAIGCQCAHIAAMPPAWHNVGYQSASGRSARIGRHAAR